jgi:hypothetical protein
MARRLLNSAMKIDPGERPHAPERRRRVEVFKLSVTAVGGERVGEGESLEGESAQETFMRLFGGMLGVDSVREWTPEGQPGRYAVVTHLDEKSGHAPGASNIFFVETDPPQTVAPSGQA